MTKTFNNTEFTTCTATFTTAGYTEPEAAILVHDLVDEFHNGDTLVWSCQMPENEQDAADILDRIAENDECSSDSADLATITR